MNMKNLKKKKIILILVLFIGISASFAFYQTNHTFENEFLTLEYGAKVEEEFESPNNWKPGDETSKVLAVKNTGDVCENVRVKYTEKWESKNGNVLSNIDSTINENVAIINLDNQNDWIQKGEYYYYNKDLLSGENTTSFLESVTFNPNYSGNITCEKIVEGNQTKQQCKPGEDSHIGGTYTLTFQVETVQCTGIEDEWEVKLEELQNKYNITYHLNGGSLKSTKLSGYPENNEEIVLPTPEKRGYDFTGWYESNDFSTERIKTIPKNSTGDKEYHANWKVKEYKIKYYLNEGVQAENPVTSYTIETETFSLPIPTKEGYTFEGWYKKSDFTGDSISEITNGTIGNEEFHAKWKIVDYNISYTLNSGTCSTCQGTYNIETETFTLATPTRTGHTFNGWTGSNGTTPQTTVTISKGSTGNKNYTANWTANTYTVSYAGNGATGGSTAATTCTYGQTFTPRANGFTRTGYTFIGWSGSTTCTGNMTMTATWVATVTNFAYTGGIQTYSVRKTGTYKLEVWGAQGGNSTGTGGLGGYSYGNKSLSAGTTLYVVVGNQPSGTSGGYNGGGSGRAYSNNLGGGAGGGATHIATRTGVLSSLASYKSNILIVAGGGGGGVVYYSRTGNGGTGGGTSGGSSSSLGYPKLTCAGGTQTSGVTSTAAGVITSNGSFGVGGSGGGGGYYGGGLCWMDSNPSGGSGGSGYISGLSSAGSTAGQRSGNGYARITIVG